jgi:hypothetical protein
MSSSKQLSKLSSINIIVKELHLDRGGEFLGKEFQQYLDGKGTERKLMVHDTSEENGGTQSSYTSQCG